MCLSMNLHVPVYESSCASLWIFMCLSMNLHVPLYESSCASLWIFMCLSMNLHVPLYEASFASLWIFMCLSMNLHVPLYESSYASLWIFMCLSRQCSTHMHHGVSPMLYYHYICFLYISCCFGLNLILKQTPNLFNYSKYAAITPTTSISTDTIEPLL